MLQFLSALTILLGGLSAAAAQSCPPGALGTERILEVDARSTPRVGRKHFSATLALGPKELVLTFDDGPWPQTTAKVLDALKRECVRATFFFTGEHSAASPALARRTLAEGHSIGHHSYSHRVLNRLPFPAALAEIDRGIEEDEYAVFGQRRSEPATPFFRFPGFASSPALLRELERRQIVVFGADVWASDWNEMGAAVEMRLILSRIEKVGRGIVLFHDTKGQTVTMLPAFLRELKRRGYRIVHVVPAGARGILR